MSHPETPSRLGESVTAPPAVLLIGLGEIGCSVMHEAVMRDWRVDGCADAAPDAARDRLATYVGSDWASRTPVKPSVHGLLADAASGAIAVLCTSSKAAAVAPDVIACVEAGIDVVTTCEEFAWPLPGTAKTLSEIDLRAKEAHRVVLATGINPGFVMDALPVVAASASLGLTRVEVRRAIPLGARREAFQRKVPTGLSVDEFEDLGEGVGHVGLEASARLVAERLGWTAESVSTDTRPIVGERGVVEGIIQTASVWAGGKERVSLRWEASDACAEPIDRIVLSGTPPLEITMRPSIHGDTGTVAMVLNGVISLARGGYQEGLRRPADAWPLVGAGLEAAASSEGPAVG